MCINRDAITQFRVDHHAAGTDGDAFAESDLKRDVPFTLLDLTPTVLGLAGVDVPTGLHGRDLSEWVLGASPADPPDCRYWRPGR